MLPAAAPRHRWTAPSAQGSSPFEHAYNDRLSIFSGMVLTAQAYEGCIIFHSEQAYSRILAHGRLNVDGKAKRDYLSTRELTQANLQL